MFRKIKARLLNDNTIIEVDPTTLQNHPDLTPKRDERMLVLMEQATRGELPLFFGAVPLGLILPFDLDYRPDLHPVGKQLIDLAFQEGSEGKLHHIIVYPRGLWFVSSDDYAYLLAAIRGRADYVPCWILGRPDNDLVKDVQGPIAVAEIPKFFGLVE